VKRDAININIILSINSTITIVNILLRIILFFNIFNIKYNLELRKVVTSKVIVLAKYILKLIIGIFGTIPILMTKKMIKE
jgi:hypothetical protein